MKWCGLRYVLTGEELAHLRNHKYDCRGKGVIEKQVDRFAREVLVPRLPTTLAPNVITLAGFLVHLAAALLVILNDHGSFSYRVPNWTCGLYIGSLVLYGVLDSADGAQARRTGSSSPLGELFDHGFDAITMSLVLASLCSLFRYSYFSVRLVLLMLGGNLVFFCAHWSSYVVGYLRFGSVDAVEGQYAVCVLFLLNMLLSFDFFWFELPTPVFVETFLQRRIETADIIFLVACIIGVVIITKTCAEVCFRHGCATFAGQSALAPLYQVILCVALAASNYLLVAYFIFDFLPQFILITLAMPFIKITWMVLMCYMGKGVVPRLDSGCLPPLLLTCWFLLMRGMGGTHTTVIGRDSILPSSTTVFNSLAVFSVLDFAYFALSNIWLISRHLGVPVLSIAPSAAGPAYSPLVNPV